jgi:prepilin-type N-terminal cleavage/methylation domain-containing protein
MSRRAFTLIEVLVVISIIMVLIGLLFPALGMVRERTSKTVTLQRIAQIGNAIETYHLQTRTYPCEQGITWTGMVPAWVPSFPSEHRECVSSLRGSGVKGLADWLEATVDFRTPAEALAKSGPVNGYSHLVDGWGQPLRYQRIDELATGALQGRAAFWVARNPPPQLAGIPGQREGFVLYGLGGHENGQDRLPTDPANDSVSEPGQWWKDGKKLMYRSDSR